jgi:GT2 family glycosyltransferase
MKILIFIVNYKADDKLIKFCRSVKEAKNDVNIITDIIVMDNSIKSDEELAELETKTNNIINGVLVFSNGTNGGYFAGIPLAQSMIKNKQDYNCIIYCNPDIILDKDFFKQLLLYQNKKCIIAPSIISIEDNFNQNPKYISRLSKEKLKKLLFLYSNIYTYCLFQWLARAKEILYKQHNTNTYTNQEIYAPHGSIFIFNDINFFLKLPKYKCFLFGEEIFIAEEARKHSQVIVYDKNIKVYDERHASINLLSCNKIRQYYFESIKFLLKEYY